MSNQDDQKKKGGGPHISDMILGSLRPRTGKETSKWIAGLADEVQDEVEAAAQQEEEAQAQAQAAAQAQQNQRKDAKHDMTHLLDHLFDCFQQYEYEFNRTVHGTDLMVSIDRPQIATETIKQRFQPSETVQVFRGRISTRQWTLLIRGRDQMIEGWVLPIDKLISFSGDPNAFVRFLFMEALWYNGEMQWRIDGMEIPWDGVRTLAKQLFGALVKVARGEASDSEPFSLRPKAHVDRSYDNMAAIKPESGPGYSFDDHNPDFDSPFISSSQRPALNPDAGRAQPPSQADAIRNADPRLRERNIQTQPIKAQQPPIDAIQHSGQHQVLSNSTQLPLPGQPINQPPQSMQHQQSQQVGNQQSHHQQPINGGAPQMQPQQPQSGPPHQSAPAHQQGQQPQPAQAQAMQHQQPAMPQQMPQQQLPQPSISQQMPLVSPAHTCSSDGMKLESALETLNIAVAHELDRLSKSGAEAFARQDFTAVEKAMKRAGKIKDLQAEIAAQVEQWKVRLYEA